MSNMLLGTGITSKTFSASEKMKSHLDCIPCFIKQSLEAARMTTDDKKVHEQVLKEVMKHLQSISFENSPPELSREVHAIIRRLTGSEDPYKEAKEESNKIGQKLYGGLKGHVETSDDSLLMATKLAIVGNVIDFGTMNRFNVDEMVNQALKEDFDDSSYSRFKEVLQKSKTILYIADNSGEIFFDKLLLEELKKLGKEITCVVKANPIINDVLFEDAKFAGIDKLANIIAGDDGQDVSTPGAVLHYASDTFLNLFKKSDMVISKGQGNYEGLSDVSREIFFMLVVKCHLVARDIKTEVGKLVLKVNT